MTTSLHPPPLEFARTGSNPTLVSMEYVRAILRGAETPTCRRRVARILADWGHPMTPQSLDSIIRFFGADGNIAEGSKGLIWVPLARGPVAEAIDRRRKL